MIDNLLDSRAALAAEIAESVRLQLRAKQDAAQLDRAIEKALFDEARRSELRLAYLRVGAAGVFSLFVFGRLLLSDTTSVAPPTTGSLGAALGWMTFSAAILMLLRRDWYRPWVRRAFPIADASLLLVGFAVSQFCTDALTRPAGL